MMKKIFLATTLLAATAASAAPRVVSSIYPLQQIANAVVGQPTELINDSYSSPHDYSIVPSDAKAINDADIVLWVRSGLIPQLAKYIERRPKDKTTLTALELPNMKLLKRDSEHKHHHHGDEEGEDEQEHHDDHDKESFDYDPHVWLSTQNAAVIAKALAAELSRLDSANKAVYDKNLRTFLADLQQTKADIIGDFESNSAPDYFVFHNAYAYFEDEFGVKHKGVVTMHGGQAPKAGTLNALKKQLKDTPNACLFREPQFDSKIVTRLAEGTGATVATLNPIGYEKDKNIGYTRIIRNIGNQIATCGKKE